MKQGWEIKKLGEVCEIVGGSTPKTNEPSYWDGEHYWVTPAELYGSKYISSTSRTITDEGVKSAHLQLLPSGTVLLSSRAPIGKVAITTAPMYCNQGFKNLVCSAQLHNEFAYWFLYLHTEYLNSLGTGATFKEISKRVVEQIPIPIPPREEQERIVAELDCLSGVIEKKREQLRELDALAQSIFYTMFGDPITNEKGWEVKKLGEVTILYNGRAFKPTDWGENGLPIVRIQNLNNHNASYNLYSGEVSNAHRLYGGELLYAWSGTPDTSFGAHIWYGTDAVLNQHIFKVEFDDNVLNKKFFLFLLNSQVHSMFDQTHGGVGLQHITKGTLTSQNVIIPHLALQQQFADKIEAIEKQKELIKKSISETETLFNARMDYYFN